MSLNKIAYTALVAFFSVVLTLLATGLLMGRSTEPATTADTLRPIGAEELATHNHRDSCWKAIDGKVYDVTSYLPEHPGDEALTLDWCGKDASAAWHNKRPGQAHSANAALLLQSYLIGQFASATAAAPPRQVLTTPQGTTGTSSRPSAKVLLGLAPGTYLDGIYRGHFSDRGEMQVSLQFSLREHRMHDIELRYLAYAGVDYLKLTEEHPAYPVLLQYRQSIAHLEGQPLANLFDLYEPGKVVDDIDAFSGATLRASKVISAVRDALNRGVYQWQ
ncbi:MULTISPECIES: cytochrome b5 domain-containing protein [Pseudomonas]|uniref:cytochrome b5 domain-containing protein n=1 Tax=Pseudomonas TaxID=286 RepID=UPI001555DF42|nr:cytochrome b5 domain-containing protein [Pseudomonas tumuqii]